MLKIITKKQYKAGQIIKIDGKKKKYKVKASIDLKWLKITKKNIFNTILEEI